MWRRGKFSALLVGMQIDAITVENSMEFPQKTKNELSFDPVFPLLEYILRIPKHQFKRIYAPLYS